MSDLKRTLHGIILLAMLPLGCWAQDNALPVVKLWGEGLSAAFTDGRFLLLSGGDTLLQSSADVRFHGASALNYAKKSFAIKLKNGGEKRNASLLGMRTDNFWILDAAAIDMSRMRNRVAMDLWLTFSHAPASFGGTKAIANGTRGQYVEVYLNDRYEGLYCLSERVDRKQLGLRRAAQDDVSGCLAKAVAWADNTCYGAGKNSSADDTQARWAGFEAKYLSLDDGEPWTWRPYTELFSFVECCNPTALTSEVDAVIDMPVMLDYVLLAYLIEAEDNVAKNYYLACRDVNDTSCKWFLTPWDMDHSFGRRYDGTKQSAAVVNVSLLKHNVLLNRLGKSEYNLEEKLHERYAELRADAFTHDRIMDLFRHYAALLRDSGAWQRERERWRGTAICPPSLDDELKYISQWLTARLQVMDTFFAYSPANAIARIPTSNPPSSFYTLSGQHVAPSHLRPGTIYLHTSPTSSRHVMFRTTTR